MRKRTSIWYYWKLNLFFLIISLILIILGGACSCSDDQDSPTYQTPASPGTVPATAAIETPTVSTPTISTPTIPAITTPDIPTLTLADIPDITVDEDKPETARGPSGIQASADSFSIDLSSYASGNTSGILWDVIGVDPSKLLVTMSGSTATFMLVENANGINTITFHIQNSYGSSDTDDVKITINPMNDAPIILGDGSATITVDEDSTAAYDLSSYFESPDGNALTFSCTAATTDITIAIDGSIITITPKPEFSGDVSLSCFASDGTSIVDSGLVVSVTSVPDAPTITSNPSLTALANSEYQYKIEVSDPDSSSFTYEKVEGPSGMNVANDGWVRWNTEHIRGGVTVRVVVKVTDDSGLSATKEYSIYVNENFVG